MTRRALFSLAAFAPQTPVTPITTQLPAYVREWEGAAVGVPNGQLKTFQLSIAPVSNVRLEVFLNGILQREGATFDYTFAGRTVTFNRAPSSGDFVTMQYYTR